MCYSYPKPILYVININKKIKSKRQPNSLSENGGDPKKQCEETTIVDNAFKKGLQNPHCLAILLMCLCEKCYD